MPAAADAANAIDQERYHKQLLASEEAVAHHDNLVHDHHAHELALSSLLPTGVISEPGLKRPGNGKGRRKIGKRKSSSSAHDCDRHHHHHQQSTGDEPEMENREMYPEYQPQQRQYYYQYQPQSYYSVPSAPLQNWGFWKWGQENFNSVWGALFN